MGTDEFDLFVIGEESGRGDFGVVEDDEIVGFQIRGEVGEHAVLDLAGVAMHDHHARSGAVVERSIGDEFFGQAVVEVSGFEHGRSFKFSVFSFKSGVGRCRVGRASEGNGSP